MKMLPIYGTMAEFDSAQHLVEAARRTHEAGYRKIDAYSPFPVEELADARVLTIAEFLLRADRHQ